LALYGLPEGEGIMYVFKLQMKEDIELHAGDELTLEFDTVVERGGTPKTTTKKVMVNKSVHAKVRAIGEVY
jgi:hypothetical protein